MQDNAPQHKARATIEWLRNEGIPTFGWPPYSPDINPIEHVWHYMKSYIETYFAEDLTRAELNRVIYEAWDAVPEDFLLSLVLTMPNRIVACIANNGGHTEY
jgi:hypothetical protein